MKKDQNKTGSSRRSFLKKSVVATAAASSLTIFSGLVNAATDVFGSGTTQGTGQCGSGGSSSHSKPTKTCCEITDSDGKDWDIYECKQNGAPSRWCAVASGLSGVSNYTDSRPPECPVQPEA